MIRNKPITRDNQLTIVSTVEDDGFIDIPPSNGGFAHIGFDNNSDFAIISFTNIPIITLVLNTSNVTNTDTDGKYCIFSNNGKVRIKNRVGTVKNIKVLTW